MLHVTHIDHPVAVAPPQVIENRGFVKVRQHSHILIHIEFWRIHLLDVTLLHGNCLHVWRERYFYCKTDSWKCSQINLSLNYGWRCHFQCVILPYHFNHPSTPTTMQIKPTDFRRLYRVQSKSTNPFILCLNDDFVTLDILNFNFNVCLLLVWYPGTLLTCDSGTILLTCVCAALKSGVLLHFL